MISHAYARILPEATATTTSSPIEVILGLLGFLAIVMVSSLTVHTLKRLFKSSYNKKPTNSILDIQFTEDQIVDYLVSKTQKYESPRFAIITIDCFACGYHAYACAANSWIATQRVAIRLSTEAKHTLPALYRDTQPFELPVEFLEPNSFGRIDMKLFTDTIVVNGVVIPHE